MKARFAAVIGEGAVISQRDDRWIALGDEVVAFIGDEARLAAEGALLARWRAVGIPAPRVLKTIDGVHVRERLHGITGEAVEPLLFGYAPPDAVARLTSATISAFGERLAASYGELAARIARVGGTMRPTSRMPGAIASDMSMSMPPRVHPNLEPVFDALALSMPARDWIRAMPAASAVIHGDLHFHNMVLAEDGSITGVFDVGDAGWDAAANDLQYAHSLGPRFAEIALAAYGPIDEEMVRRAHARAAIGHLIWHPIGAPRHASIVSWVQAVLRQWT